MSETLVVVYQNLMELTLTPSEILIGVLVTGGILLAWYYAFWKPLDWHRDFIELGFDEVNRSKKHNDVAKKHQINELRQRRKRGEVPPVYPNGWFAILESDELPQKGVKEIYALGLNLVAWRGTTGQSYVADAYCPHLGAHLGVGGKVSGECIECPFHGWKFHGSDGSLKDIPYSDSCTSLIGSKSTRINIRTTKEVNGHIFLWFHAEGDEPTWTPAPIPEIESKQWSYRGRSEFIVDCHIQDILENGADVSHFSFIHSPAIMCGVDPDSSVLKWNFFKHTLSGKWQPCEEPGQKHVADLTVTAQMCLFGKFNILPLHVEVKQYGPGIVIYNFFTSLGRAVLVHTVTPVGAFEQRILHRFYTSSTLIHPIAKLLLLGEVIMFERDVRVWNRKTFIGNPPLVKEDKGIQSFRRWCSQFYSPNSPRLYFSNNNDNSNTLEF